MRKLWILLILFCALLAEELPNAPISRVAVSGNHVYSADDILTRANVRTRRGALLDYPILQEDMHRIMALGGFRSVDVDIRQRGRGLQVVFLVEENPVIKDVEFIGNVSLDEERILRFWQNRPGEQLNYLTLGQDIENLNRLYRKDGYDLSSVQKVELVSENILRAEISEPRVSVISVSGNAYAKDELVLREMALQPGNVYNAQLLAADRARIFRLGYFSSVALPEILPAENPGEIDIYLNVQERKKNALNIGLGITSQEQFVFTRFSLLNLFNTGEQIQINTQFGQEYRIQGALPKFNYNLRLYYPWFLARDMSWGATRYLSIRYERLRNSGQNVSEILPIRRDGFSTDLGTGLPYLDRRYHLTFEYKDEFVQDDPPRANPNIAYLKRSLAVVYTYNGLHHRGDTSIITNGDFLRVRFENGGALHSLGRTVWDLGGADFRRSELQYSRYLSLSDNNHIAVMSFRNGAYVSPREINILEGEEYSVGGGTTVRGYADIEPFAIGPRMLILNAEYRYIFNDSWQGVLFYDWGNAYTDTRVRVRDFKSGYGGGIRISTPVGPLRFDLGRGEQWWVFHFGIGTAF